MKHRDDDNNNDEEEEGTYKSVENAKIISSDMNSRFVSQIRGFELSAINDQLIVK